MSYSTSTSNYSEYILYFLGGTIYLSTKLVFWGKQSFCNLKTECMKNVTLHIKFINNMRTHFSRINPYEEMYV
jgi:hypothetical protein